MRDGLFAILHYYAPEPEFAIPQKRSGTQCEVESGDDASLRWLIHTILHDFKDDTYAYFESLKRELADRLARRMMERNYECSSLREKHSREIMFRGVMTTPNKGLDSLCISNLLPLMPQSRVYGRSISVI